MIDTNDLRLEVETLEPRNLLDYTTAGVAPTPPTNLITNGAFTTNITGWTAGTGWTNTWNAGQFLRATGTSASVITYWSQAASAGQVINGSVQVTPGGTTPLQNGPETYQAYIIAYNASNVSLGVVAQSAAETWPAGAGNIGYRTLTVNTINPTPANTATVRFEVWKNSAQAVTVDIDNASMVVETSGVTGWTATGTLVTNKAQSWTLAGNAFYLRAMGGQAGFLTNTTVAATDVNKYVGASVMATGNTYARIGIQWLNASSTQISIDYSPYYFLNSNAQRMEFRGRPPAGAVRPVFRVYLYSNPQASNPVWGAEAYLDAAVLVSVATPELDDDLTYATANDTPNYIANPSGQAGTFGWTETDNAGYFHNSYMNQSFDDRQYNYQWVEPADYSASTKPVMIYSLDADVLTPGAYSNAKAITAGQYVGGSVRMYARIPTHVGRAGWTFLNSTGGIISTSWTSWVTPYDASTNVANGLSRYYKLPSMVAPAGAVRVRMELEWAKTSAPVAPADNLYYGHWFMFWDAGMTIGATVGEVDNLPAQNPTKYRNILTTASEISVKKGDLEVGILSAFVHDAKIDPANDPTMKIGSEVRLRAKVDGVFQNVFVGKVQSLKTTYNRKGNPEIELMAVDAVADLVKQQRTQGVSTIPETGALLQAVDIPWTVNGSGQYTGTPTYSYTKDASLMEHITITRDTAKGYAWVDNNGVLRIYDKAQMPYVDARLVLTDKAKPAATAIRTNLIENPTGNTAGANRWGVYGVSGAQSSRGHLVTGPATAATLAANALNGFYLTPNATKFVDTTTQVAVSVQIKATKACRVQLGFPSYANTFQSIQPFADLTAGQTITLNGTFNIATYFGSNQKDFKPMIQVTNSGSSTAIAGGLGEILAIEWVQMENGFSAPSYFNGDSTYAYWMGTPYDSNSVYDVSQWISYTDIQAGWDSGQTINSVLVKVLSGTTETDNGPYISQSSIDNYGYSKLDATIATGPAPATWANDLIASKSAPVVMPSAIRLAATDAASFKKVASIDLYASVQVEYGTKILGQYRVTSVEHSIRPGKWTTTLTFNNRINSTLW